MYLSSAQSYETFYGRNLQMFLEARVFVRGKFFQPGLMFVSKALERG